MSAKKTIFCQPSSAFALGCVLAVCGATRAGGADLFFLRGRPPLEGTFRQYEENFFVVQGQDGKTYRLHETTLLRFELTEPVEVAAALRGRKERFLFRLRSYAPPYVIGERNGQPCQLSLRDLKTLSPPDDLCWDETYTREGEVISQGEPVAPDGLWAPGRITLVHFHNREFPESDKLELYLSRVQRLSGGEVKYRIVLLPDPGCPAARQFQISSVPEVWVFNARGERVRALRGPADARAVDAAIAEARNP